MRKKPKVFALRKMNTAKNFIFFLRRGFEFVGITNIQTHTHAQIDR